MRFSPLFLLPIILFLLSGCSTPVTEVDYPLSVREVEVQTPPCEELLVVLDAGHGGKDSGAKSLTKPITLEKELTLKTTHYVNHYLKKLGIKTALTRNDDTFVPLQKRASWANSLGANLFVSIHFNSAASKLAEGIEVFYYQSPKNIVRTNASKALGESILASLIQNTRAKSRGVKHGDLCVIRETQIPAVLIEGGFMSHSKEMQNLRNDVYIKKLAWSIAIGIKQFVSVL